MAIVLLKVHIASAEQNKAIRALHRMTLIGTARGPVPSSKIVMRKRKTRSGHIKKSTTPARGMA
jgi:hypothetical protein